MKIWAGGCWHLRESDAEKWAAIQQEIETKLKPGDALLLTGDIFEAFGNAPACLRRLESILKIHTRLIPTPLGPMPNSVTPVYFRGNNDSWMSVPHNSALTPPKPPFHVWRVGTENECVDVACWTGLNWPDTKWSGPHDLPTKDQVWDALRSLAFNIDLMKEQWERQRTRQVGSGVARARILATHFPMVARTERFKPTRVQVAPDESEPGPPIKVDLPAEEQMAIDLVQAFDALVCSHVHEGNKVPTLVGTVPQYCVVPQGKPTTYIHEIPLGAPA